MSEATQENPESVEKPPTKKAAAAPAKKSGSVTVYMIGNSRGNQDGQQRRVAADVAKQLIDNGLARTKE